MCRIYRKMSKTQKGQMTFFRNYQISVFKERRSEFIYIGYGKLQEQIQQWIIHNNLTDIIRALDFRNDSAEIVCCDGNLFIYSAI